MNNTKSQFFECLNCHKQIKNSALGTANRNHCPECLWSKHVDLNISGDRESKCLQAMKPMGLTFKREGLDKWGKEKQGELMLVHQCCGCNKVSINRIAGDDDPSEILKILKASEDLDQTFKNTLGELGIKLLTEKDLGKVKTQLFGN